MKIKIKNIEDCRKLFQVEIPKELVKKIAEETYQDIKKIAKIPGFRAGNAPRDIVEKHHGNDVKEETLRRLVPEGYKKALDTHKVIPIGEPAISNIDFDLDKALKFEAEVDVYPSFKLRNYKGIKVKKTRISISEKEKNDALEKVQNLSATYENVDHPVQKGDYTTCDVEAFIDGKSISKKNQNMWVQADKTASLLGMGEELIGLTKGQTKEVETKLPDNYPDKKYAGKLAKFKIEVKEVKEKKLPTIDDAFAKTLKIDSADLLKQEIEAQILRKKEEMLKVDMENQLLDKLLKDNKFSVPSSIVKRQKDVFAKRLQMDLLKQGLPQEEADKKIKEFDAKLAEDAESKVKIYFILDDVAQKENIEVNKNDVEARMQGVALSTGQTPEKVKNYYEKNKLMGGLQEEIKELKVLSFLMKNSDIEETK